MDQKLTVKIDQLPVLVMKELGYFVAFSPVLDIATQGDTLAEAKRRFGEVVEIFFEETLKSGTLFSVLTMLGWEQKDNTLLPPVVVERSIEPIQMQSPEIIIPASNAKDRSDKKSSV